jgi:hypothetical protein
MPYAFVRAYNGGTGNTAPGNSFSVNQATTAGDDLFCIIFTSANVTVTPPSGWAQIGSTLTDSLNIWLNAFEYLNAPNQTGAKTWGFSANCVGGGVFMEFSGGATSGADNSNVTHTGASSTTLSSGSLADTNSSDLLLNFMAYKVGVGFGAGNFSGPTNSFILNVAGAQLSVGATPTGVVVCGAISYRILTTSGGPYSTNTTLSSPGGPNASLLAGFLPVTFTYGPGSDGVPNGQLGASQTQQLLAR